MSFVFTIVLPTWAIAAVLVKWLETAAERADDTDRTRDLISNAADISMRIEHLERAVLRPEGASRSE